MKLDKKTHISVFITDDVEMKKLNKDHLGRDYPTDVLSFEIKEKLEDGSLYLGDVVVNKDQAKRQCKEYGNDLETFMKKKEKICSANVKALLFDNILQKIQNKRNKQQTIEFYYHK